MLRLGECVDGGQVGSKVDREDEDVKDEERGALVGGDVQFTSGERCSASEFGLGTVYCGHGGVSEEDF